MQRAVKFSQTNYFRSPRCFVRHCVHFYPPVGEVILLEVKLKIFLYDEKKLEFQRKKFSHFPVLSETTKKKLDWKKVLFK